MNSAIPGVSVVVCCHNSAARLPRTLEHLAGQVVAAHLPWEVLLVDNASTDDTASCAQGLWPADSPCRLRVVREAKVGLSHARRRGFAEARYEYISFIDDDNWVIPEWVGLVDEIFSTYPAVAACGGPTEAVFEAPPPAWFGDYQGNFAVGPQHASTGDVTDSDNRLWGAGLSLRKTAWLKLQRSDFQFALSGRSGTRLTSGEDQELCYALVLDGGRLWYDARLRLRHYMPAGRLQWSYLRRLLRAAGWSGAWLDPYREILRQEKPANPLGAALKIAGLLGRNPLRLARHLLADAEGSPAAVSHELLLGRLTALLGCRNEIAELRTRLRSSMPAQSAAPSARISAKPSQQHNVAADLRGDHSAASRGSA